MNKDFFTKPISLKDIDLKKINLSNIKNKKEIIIGTLILIYIIGIFCFGNYLLKARSEVKDQYEIKEKKYTSLQKALSEDEINKQIDNLNNEIEELSGKITTIENNNEITKIFNDFKAGAPITWEQQDIRTRTSSKELEEYEIYTVNVSSFTGTLEQIEQFLEYVENYDKIVRIDSLGFKKNQITGRLSGQFRASFYFKKLS